MSRKKSVSILIIVFLVNTSLAQASSVDYSRYFFALTILVTPGQAFNMESQHVGGEGNNIWIEGPDGNNYTESCAVRKAICYAIDREEMNQVIHDGEYTMSHNPMYLYTAFYYYDDVMKYERIIASAWRWFDSTRRYKVGINTTVNQPLILGIVCLMIISKLVDKNKTRKERRKANS